MPLQISDKWENVTIQEFNLLADFVLDTTHSWREALLECFFEQTEKERAGKI